MEKSKESVYTVFAKLYTNRVKLYNKKMKLEKEIEERLKEQSLLKTIILQKDAEVKGQKEFTFSLAKGSDVYFEVLELITEPNIIYKARRTYNSYKEDNVKMVYTCEIKNNEMSILADDGTIWKGGDVWKKFVDTYQPILEFKSIDHFFGLNYKPIQTRIDVKYKIN